MDGSTLAYAAGFLDGEGCFGFYVRSVRIECNHTHRPTLEFLSELFGGTVRSVKYSGKNKPQFNWRLCGLKAARALDQLAPYLREKKAKAEELVQLYANGKVTGKKWAQNLCMCVAPEEIT